MALVRRWLVDFPSHLWSPTWTAVSMLVSLKDLVYLTDLANDMMLLNLSASAMETTPSTTAPRQQQRSGGGVEDRSAVLVRIASRPWIDKADDVLRLIFLLEEEAFAAWMMGGIVLPSPPGFLVCTHPRATRNVMLDFC